MQTHCTYQTKVYVYTLYIHIRQRCIQTHLYTPFANVSICRHIVHTLQTKVYVDKGVCIHIVHTFLECVYIWTPSGISRHIVHRYIQAHCTQKCVGTLYIGVCRHVYTFQKGVYNVSTYTLCLYIDTIDTGIYRNIVHTVSPVGIHI